jgi:hypothetical protein
VEQDIMALPWDKLKDITINKSTDKGKGVKVRLKKLRSIFIVPMYVIRVTRLGEICAYRAII